MNKPLVITAGGIDPTFFCGDYLIDHDRPAAAPIRRQRPPLADLRVAGQFEQGQETSAHSAG